MKGENVTALPNKERDTTQAAIDALTRIMPEQARMGKMMQEEFVKAGFTGDEALQLVAYALFK